MSYRLLEVSKPRLPQCRAHSWYTINAYSRLDLKESDGFHLCKTSFDSFNQCNTKEETIFMCEESKGVHFLEC